MRELGGREYAANRHCGLASIGGGADCEANAEPGNTQRSRYEQGESAQQCSNHRRTAGKGFKWAQKRRKEHMELA